MSQREYKTLESSEQGLFSRLRIRPFKLDIVFLFCLIIIPTVMAVTTFTYNKNSAAALEMANKLVEKITNAVIEKTTNYLKPAHVLASITSRLLNDPTVNIGPGSELEDYLISILRAQPQIDFVYFGNEDGDFIDAVWVKEDEPIILKYIYKESGRPVMTYRYFNEKNELFKEKKTEEILTQLEKHFSKLITVPIHYSSRISESPSWGQTIYEYDRRTRVAKDYAKLAGAIS